MILLFYISQRYECVIDNQSYLYFKYSLIFLLWYVKDNISDKWTVDWYLDAKSDVIKQVQNDADNDMFKL